MQFLKQILQTYVDKEIKQIHPNMNDAEVLQDVKKYNLSSSIDPRWHEFQPQDLLAMIERFRMPIIFLL